MTLELPLYAGLAIILLAMVGPFFVVYLVVQFIRWQDGQVEKKKS